LRAEDWRGLIDGLMEGVLVVDALDLRVAEVNRAACAMLGVGRDDLLNQPIIEIAVTPEDICFWEDAAAGLVSEILSDSMFRRADGSTLNVDRRVSLVRLGGDQAFFVVGLRDQSDQRRLESELETMIAELRATLESTADGVLVTDLSEGIRSCNRRFADLWDMPDELRAHRDDVAVFSWLAGAVVDRDGYLERLREIHRSPLLETTDLVVLRSGRVLERVSNPQYARGRPVGRVFSFRDVTERLVGEARLQLASKVFEASLDAIFVTDGDFRIVAVNPGCTRLTGYDPGVLMELNLGELLFSADDADLAGRIVRESGELGFWEGEVWFRRASGAGSPGMVSMVRLASEDATPLPGVRAQAVIFIKDLSERVAANKRIEELAYNDALTGLPNRVQLNQRILFSLNLATREQIPLAILFLDLDRFKQINDSLGHLFGDRVLVEVASRIRSCLRTADTAARLGGDEFVLLLHDTDSRGAEIAARRILGSLAEPMLLDGMCFTVTCSIGIALFPGDGRTLDELIKNADTAMYRVKDRGRSGFRFYQPQMNVDLLSRMKLEHAMRAGLETNAFRLHYQPQVAFGDGRIVGAEALLRWNDRELGEIPPARFIPVAEESGFIVALGHWVLLEAVRQARCWLDEGLDLVVAVNVSALQFQQANFVESIDEALRREALPPQRLEVELTESILIHDAEEALGRLKTLAALGVKISIDDFGTGYSSLTYLKKFPIQKLKIDRGFIRGLPDDESDAAITRAIVHLGQALRLQIIAEGVETEAQHAFLLEKGCDEFQGFLCSPAVPPEEFLRLYRHGASFRGAVTTKE
jgi:diguanylate cyclase (GGDEF)-like protein/PAS domain S-box-containing protein